MAIEVDRVIVALEAQLDNYDRRLNDAERHFDRTMHNIDGSAKRTEARVTTAFRGIGTASAVLGIGIGALAGAMTAGAAAALVYASNLAEVARQTGLTVEQVQVLERAAIRNNFTMEQASNAVGDLNRKLGEARSGSASAMQAFASIGISKEQLDSFRTARDALPVVMDRIRELATESEQAAAANRLFGESGERLLPFLRQGADGYESLAEEARRAGLITAEQANEAEHAKQRLQELALTIRTQLAGAMVEAIPLLENMAGLLGRIGSGASGLWNWLREARRGNPVLAAVTAALFESPSGGRPGSARESGSAGLIESAFRQGLGPQRRLGPASVGSDRKPRGRSGPSPEEIARREAEAERRFRFELSQIEEDIIAARQIWATSSEQVAAFEIRQIEAARDRENENYRAEAENARTNRELAAARAGQLIEANNRLAAQRIESTRLRQEEQERQNALDLARASLQSEADIERAVGQLAETRQQQRDSALALLDLTLEQERVEQEAVLASREATEAQKEIARARLAILGRLRDAETASILRSTESPRERYLRSVNRTAEQMSDDLDEVAIRGFERLNDELSEAVAGFINLGGVAGRVLSGILADLLRIGIQRQIIGPIANALFGGGGGGGFDPISTVASAFAGGGSLFRFASGGSFIVGGRSGVDQNVMSINGRPVARVSHGEMVNVTPQGASFGALPGIVGPGGGSGLIKVQLALSGDIDARIVQVSGPVAVEVVQQSTPGIVRAAGAETMRAAGRPRLNR